MKTTFSINLHYERLVGDSVQICKMFETCACKRALFIDCACESTHKILYFGLLKHLKMRNVIVVHHDLLPLEQS
jgi:hypothetical protein